MKKIKLITLSILSVFAVLYFSCNKQSIEGIQTNLVERGTGGLPDDPKEVEKVPLVVSKQYLANLGGIPVSLSNKPSSSVPVVSITSPKNNDTLHGDITISATATDPTGISSVSCYIDNTLLSTDVTAPYAFTWATIHYAGGTHIIKVTAKNSSGRSSSTSIQVIVYNATSGGGTGTTGDITPPNVTIVTPVNGSSYLYGTVISITSTATDNVGVKTVGYKLDGLLSYQSSISPYSFNWTLNLISGVHTIQAIATDSAGNQGLSSIVSIVVNATVVAPPVGGVPSAFLLSCPGATNQGSEGSCMGFTVSNGASIEWYYRNHMSTYSFSTNIFSPEYIYDYGVFTPGACSNGSGLVSNLKIVQDSGVCTWSLMPYTSGTCTPNVNDAQRADAALHKMTNARMSQLDSAMIKQTLYAGHPIMIGIAIDNNFMNAGPGYIWKTYGTYYGSHGVVVVGYDDSKHAYKIMNSWGTGWGDYGFLWVDYNIMYNYSSSYWFYFN